MLKNTVLLVVFICSFAFVTGQEKSSSLPFAQKTNYFLSKANKSYRALQYANAAVYFKKYLAGNSKKANPLDQEAAILGLADCYWNMREYRLVGSWYNQLPASVKESNKTVQYRMAEMLAMDKKYPEASKSLAVFPQFKARANGFLEVDEMNKDSADWAVNYLELNTSNYREFSPLLISNKFFWSTNEPSAGPTREIASWDGNDYMHILSISDTSLVKQAEMPGNEPDTASTQSKKFIKLAEHYSLADVEQLKTVKLPRAIVKKRNTTNYSATPIVTDERIRYNVANPTFSALTQKIYFSVNRQGKPVPDSPNAKLSITDKELSRQVAIAEADLGSNNITNIKFLPIESKAYSVMHPAIHPNGKLLVYSSNQPGGKGGFDLYSVNRIDDTTWSAPASMTSLNTAGNELFAGFSSTGDLYFSSDGYPGFGGLDIIKAPFNKDGTIQSVEYLPEPLNSSHDDFGFTQTIDGKKGFISSDRYSQQDDIYVFDYNKKIVNISGYVFSRFTEARKPGVKILFNRITKGTPDKEVESQLTNANGEFKFQGRPNYEYAVTVDNGGDDIQQMEFSTKNIFDEMPLGIFYVDKKKELVIQEPKPKSDTTRFIIYFAFDKFSLTNKAKRVLNEVAALLNKNSGLKAVLDGHTDLWGDDEYNLELSDKRVKEVCLYFSKQGLSADKTDCSQFYGKRRPIYNTLDRSVSVKNRRVEILVTTK